MDNTQGKFPCPYCGGPSAVYDSRQHGEMRKRRRICAKCHTFETWEMVANEGKPATLDEIQAIHTED